MCNYINSKQRSRHKCVLQMDRITYFGNKNHGFDFPFLLQISNSNYNFESYLNVSFRISNANFKYEGKILGKYKKNTLERNSYRNNIWCDNRVPNF